VDPEITRTMVARKPCYIGQAERKNRSDRSKIDAGPAKREQIRVHAWPMRVSSPAESATSRSPTTNVRIPISDTPCVQASRSTIEHVPHPLVRIPISDTPSVQASRSTIERAPLPHISNVRVPVEVDTIPVARDLISWPDERADMVDANPQSKGVMCRSEYVARSERYEATARQQWLHDADLAGWPGFTQHGATEGQR
jgi:hypothetical protein